MCGKRIFSSIIAKTIELAFSQRKFITFASVLLMQTNSSFVFKFVVNTLDTIFQFMVIFVFQVSDDRSCKVICVLGHTTSIGGVVGTLAPPFVILVILTLLYH
jgi:hypothetical protein